MVKIIQVEEGGSDMASPFPDVEKTGKETGSGRIN